MSPRLNPHRDPYANVSKNYTTHELARDLLSRPDGMVGISTTPGTVQYAIVIHQRGDREVLIAAPEVVYTRSGQRKSLPLTAEDML